LWSFYYLFGGLPLFFFASIASRIGGAVSNRKLLTTFNLFVCLDSDCLGFLVEFIPTTIGVLAFDWRINVAAECITEIILSVDNTIVLIDAYHFKIALIFVFCFIPR
jgi:hypothetical protein